MQKRITGQGGISHLLLGAGILLMAGAAALLFLIYAKDRQDRKQYEYLRERYTIQGVEVDFSGLWQENPQVAAWIAFDNPELPNYPCMYSGDNQQYLRQDLYGNPSIGGCIFMEAANSGDFQDYHTILYGHNMKNGTMFGSLKQYRSESFYRENSGFIIFTPKETYRYEIFACQDVPVGSSVYTVGFGPDERYEAFLNTLLEKKYPEFTGTLSKDSHVLTLSTCSAKGQRLVIHAVRVEE